MTELAARGLAPEAGALLEIARNEVEMAAAIAQLLESPDECAEKGRAARDFVGVHHAWKDAAAGLDRLLEASIDRRVRGGRP